MASNNLPQSSGTLKVVHSTEKQIYQYEDADQTSAPNHTQIGMFGDFCLMCGEMIDGEGFDGSSAYCSEQCEYHQHLMSDSESDWCDLSVEGYQLPSYGGSTTVSSANITPLNSPHLQPSDRLAILCSGPPPCELLLPLDLDERLLGAKAVAERYLENGTQSLEDEGDSEDDKRDAMVKITHHPHDPAGRIGPKDPLAQATSTLKSRPALAQLTDFNHLVCLSELSAKKENLTFALHSQSTSFVDLASPNFTAIDHLHPTTSTSKSSRRVSEPVFGQLNSFSSFIPHHPRSSFSFSSLASQSHVPLNWSNDFSQKKC